MITVAENYEIVAKRAEAREAHVSMPNYPKQKTWPACFQRRRRSARGIVNPTAPVLAPRPASGG
jgi:hypothetical protein